MNQTEKITPFHWMTEPQTTHKPSNVQEFVNPDDIPWTDWLMPGTRYKLLYCDLASGVFSLLLQVDPGVKATVHWHFGTAQAYILEGSFYYDKDDVGNTKNCFTTETGGSVHQPISEEGCLMFATLFGPIAGYHEGKMVVVADSKLHYELAKQNNAAHLTTVVGYIQEPQKNAKA